jgi:hypothetical protein
MKVIRVVFFLLLLSFNGWSQGSPDWRAKQIADSVMWAMGGKQNWDNTQYLRWNFFGRRTLWWNKWSGEVRIEIPARKLVLLSNINTKTGSAFRNGREITQPDSVIFFNDRAYKILVNDSYWLAMPFKLLDPGVNLSYLGTGNDSAGKNCSILQLTFHAVGVTPENKYHVWVDQETYLVTQWAYFEKFTDEQPALINPWQDYRRYGTILLSAGRGPEEGMLTEISVDPIPAETFIRP